MNNERVIVGTTPPCRRGKKGGGESKVINVEPIEKIIKCVLASGKLEDERPLSGIIVAPVECGKTTLIRKHCLRSHQVFYTTDATAFGIIRDTDNLKLLSPNGEVTHIVIPDLLTCFGRKAETVNTFIHFMNSLIEEGVVNISTYAVHIKSPIAEVKAGLITAIPPGPFSDKRRHWKRIGFLSRALPISYDYNAITEMDIFSYIEDQKHLAERLQALQLGKKPKKIILPTNLAKSLEPLAIRIAANLSKKTDVFGDDRDTLHGFRSQRQLQTFAKALALLDGKDEVDKGCIKEVMRLSEFLNLDGNKV